MVQEGSKDAFNKNRKIRVGFLGTRGFPSSYGGFETAVRHIAPYFSHLGLDVSVFCRKSSGVEKLQGHKNDIRQIFTWGINTQSLSTLTFGLTSAIWSITHKFDVLIIMNVANGFYLPLLKLFGIKTIVNVDGIEWERAKWNYLGKKFFYFGAELSSLFADEIVCDSEEIARYWKRVFNRESTYIPYGAESQYLSKKRISSTLNGKYVLYLARLVPENSILQFLDSIEFLPSDMKIVIVGSTNDKEIEQRLKYILKTKQNVQITGHIDDQDKLHAIWSNAYVYFHGHTVGGTNPTLVQSLFYGLRIVAVDSPYNIEVAQKNAIYTSSNPLDIASNLMKEFYSSSSREIPFPKKFTWERVSAEYLRLVNKVTLY